MPKGLWHISKGKKGNLRDGEGDKTFVIRAESRLIDHL